MVTPFFSILVPTRDRPDLAATCVRSILAQGDHDFELLVLDQSDGSATGEAVRAVAGDSGRTRHVRVSGRGRSRSLNAGIEEARGKWVVMTDDDCEAEPGWLDGLTTEARAAGPRDAIVGRVVPGPVEPGKSLPPATIEDLDPAVYTGRVDRDLVYPNFAVPRSVFDVIGRFDVRMGVGTSLPGGEDNDFGYRLLRAGWRIIYRPGPTVVHCAWRSTEERAALKRAYGTGQGAFYAKHLAAADPFIAYRFARDVARTTRAAGGALIRRWPSECRGHLDYLVGLFIGAGRMTALMVRGVPPDPTLP
jgi:glycosyltransferase involved in cell wall biosynthesis